MFSSQARLIATASIIAFGLLPVSAKVGLIRAESQLLAAQSLHAKADRGSRGIESILRWGRRGNVSVLNRHRGGTRNLLRKEVSTNLGKQDKTHDGGDAGDGREHVHEPRTRPSLKDAIDEKRRHNRNAKTIEPRFPSEPPHSRPSSCTPRGTPRA